MPMIVLQNFHLQTPTCAPHYARANGQTFLPHQVMPRAGARGRATAGAHDARAPNGRRAAATAPRAERHDGASAPGRRGRPGLRCCGGPVSLRPPQPARLPLRSVEVLPPQASSNVLSRDSFEGWGKILPQVLHFEHYFCAQPHTLHPHP